MVGNEVWIKEDAPKGNEVDTGDLRPLVQLGTTIYGMIRETFKLLRPKLQQGMEEGEPDLRKVLDE